MIIIINHALSGSCLGKMSVSLLTRRNEWQVFRIQQPRQTLSSHHERCSFEIASVPRHVTISGTQRWSPRGHGLGLEALRGQLVMSLALASNFVSLALALDVKMQNVYRDVFAEQWVQFIATVRGDVLSFRLNIYTQVMASVLPRPWPCRSSLTLGVEDKSSALALRLWPWPWLHVC